VTLDNNVGYSGHPSTTKTNENVAQIKRIVHESRRVTIHDLVNEVETCLDHAKVMKQNLNT
jgi:hypothetical protein